MTRKSKKVKQGKRGVIYDGWVVNQRGNPVRYCRFSDVKTGLKDKSLQDESVESGVEASEFAQSVNEDIVSCPENDLSTAKASSNREDDYAKLRHQSCTRFAASPKQIDLKTVFLRLMKQLILQTTYKSVAIFIAIFFYLSRSSFTRIFTWIYNGYHRDGYVLQYVNGVSKSIDNNAGRKVRFPYDNTCPRDTSGGRAFCDRKIPRLVERIAL